MVSPDIVVLLIILIVYIYEIEISSQRYTEQFELLRIFYLKILLKTQIF